MYKNLKKINPDFEKLFINDNIQIKSEKNINTNIDFKNINIKINDHEINSLINIIKYYNKNK